MPDQLDRLKAALADRYAIERELGAGGMATVNLAYDLKRARKVAGRCCDLSLAPHWVRCAKLGRLLGGC